jgi:hypothetical protein
MIVQFRDDVIAPNGSRSFAYTEVQCDTLELFWKLDRVASIINRGDFIECQQYLHKDYLHTELWAVTATDGKILICNVRNEGEIAAMNLEPLPKRSGV